MILKEEISDFDWIQVPSDFAPGDDVMVQTPEYRGIGRVIELSEERLYIQTEKESLHYDSESDPPFPEIFHYLLRIPDLSAIGRGTILSRPEKTQEGKWYRQYAEATDLVRNEDGKLEELYLFVMNGPESDAVLEIVSTHRRSIVERMASWQIEE